VEIIYSREIRFKPFDKSKIENESRADCALLALKFQQKGKKVGFCNVIVWIVYLLVY